MLNFRLDESDIERFWSLVDKNGPVVYPELGECWVWTGATSQFGHGQFTVRSFIHKHKKYSGHGAHRIAWVLAHPDQDIPPNNVVRHRCDNPPCVRSDHLELGTKGDNTRDMWLRGRAIVGERHYAAQLTDDAVLAMRADYAANGTAITELARRYGVTDMTVRDVLIGKTWRHITDGVPVVPPAQLSESEHARRKSVAGPKSPREGVHHHKTRLTPDQVQQMCTDHVTTNGRTGLVELSEQYGVTQTAVHLILTGKNWKSITGGKNIYISARKALTADRRRQIEQLRSTMNQSEIARHLGISQAAVHYLMTH